MVRQFLLPHFQSVVVRDVVVVVAVVVSDVAQQQGEDEMPFSLFSRAKAEVVVVVAADAVVVVAVIELSQYFYLQAVARESS